MNKYCEQLHESYQTSIGAFIKSYPLSDGKLIKSIDNYSRACALYIWNKLNVDAFKCAEVLNYIYSSESSKVVYSAENIKSAMNKISESNYSIPVPNFFLDIIHFDIKHGSYLSRCLTYCFETLDIIYALIDEEMDAEEANIIASLQQKLISECNKNGVKNFKYDINPYDYIKTENNDVLYVTAKRLDEEKAKNNNIYESKHQQNQTVTGSIKPSILELDDLIGLSEVKKEIHEVSNFIKIQRARQSQGLPTSDVSFHLVFTGNPGTGKTTVARLITKIYKELGVVSQGQLIEVSAKDLVAGYVGQTAIKTGDVIKKALGGVLFIDEAYSLLDKSGQGFGQEAIDTLLKEMEDKRDNLVVIVAGYNDLMHAFIDSNPGLKSRFNKYINFADYNADEMYQIFCMLCRKANYIISDDAQELIKKYFISLCATKDNSFANGRTVRNIFENVISKQASRIATNNVLTKDLLSIITADDVQKSIGKQNEKERLEDVLEELNSLIGLDEVKAEISELVYIVQNQQRRKKQGLKVPKLSLHLVFMGNPGTGKTTVARCIARIYKCLGLLSKGQLVETDRSGLVAGYVGQTAIKTQNVIQTALGGVLFIDEAYTLSNGSANDFGQEAIDTLLKAMEDKREDFVVIVAGYNDLMEDFIHSNPGLESRFNRYINFEDYTSEQMGLIFYELCNKNQYILSNEAKKKIEEYFDEVKISDIGNGRGARNLFEKVISQQAKRIECSNNEKIDLQEIIADDIEIAKEK